MTAPVRIANCSGFYGDRLAAAREMVEDGPIDVLTGDWLAELTMLILWKDRLKDPDGGYAKTFVRQVEQVLGTCLERGVRIVSNAGGLNPVGCAAAVREVARRLGLQARVASVSGDDLLGRVDRGWTNLDTGEVLGDRVVLSANAYLGGWGIADALTRGADVVVTGRVTDAAVVVGPAAWHHGWARDDWDALAGAVVAGHVIECGTQATGGNYPFFTEVPGLEHPGFPIAEIAADGSSVITKHDGTGGLVSVGTVTAQLLYESTGARYLNPDVTARFDTVQLSQVGPDRVQIAAVTGEPPPATSKVCLNLAGMTKASLSFPLTGLDIEAKADLLLRSLLPSLDVASVETELVRTDTDDPATNAEATAHLRLTLRDPDATKLEKGLRQKVVELGLATYPGFYGGPSTTMAYGVYWPTLVPSSSLVHVVDVEGEVTEVAPTPADGPVDQPASVEPSAYSAGETRRVPLGVVAGARSGDKGGNANVGVWVRSDEAWPWLDATLTVERLQELLPETAALRVDRFAFPQLRAVNFVVHGLLGEGVASSSRTDAQAKSLGEWLRARHVEVPVELL